MIAPLLSSLFEANIVLPMGYIGPGLGAGAIATVFGVLGSIVLFVVGVVYYPIKRLVVGRRRHAERDSALPVERAS